ncbi:MAG: glutamine--fructose-6-phosphate transaminase (isomerizing) [Geminicoccaceae bacterium]
MCGIVGLINCDNVVPKVVRALEMLEYRGYDSAGIAALGTAGIERRRSVGRIANLADLIDDAPVSGRTAIGHTRWATHGRPSEANAHPHAAPKVAVVHNGIIENHAELRRELQARGYRFESETDSEVIPKLIHEAMATGAGPEEATRKALAQLHGTFAVCAVFEGHDGMLVAGRKGSPLVVGVTDDGAAVASDILALAPFTRDAVELENGDVAVLHCGSLTVWDDEGHVVLRPRRELPPESALVTRDGHDHFMRKEILEQPSTLTATLAQFLDASGTGLHFPTLPVDLAAARRLVIVACGTSSYSGEAAKHWFEHIAGLRTEVEIASEFRNRAPLFEPSDIVLVISQSGETADTLAALREVKRLGVQTVGLVNVAHSAIAREVDAVLLTKAGTEIGVASTKAFSAQLMALACLAVHAARVRGRIDAAREAELVAELATAPGLVARALDLDGHLKCLAAEIATAHCTVFLGRGTGLALAREGALKLEETAYIPSLGIAAGELKHGPIALIDERVPVVALVQRDATLEKTLANLHEVAARGGKVIAVGDAAAIGQASDVAHATVELPVCGELATAMVQAVPMQLLAYHTAVACGCDVDKPRNLAKSVTVE